MQTRTGRLPNFFIVGAAKAGTTAFAEWLRAHPQIFIPAEKELNFFDRYWKEDVSGYAARFAEAGEASAVGEGTPYMSDADAPARMASVVPDAKLIALLRNPVDRAYSHYWHTRAFKAEKRTFAEVIRDEEAATTGVRNYLSEGLYLDQLRRLTEHFPRENLLVLLFEDVKQDPRGSFKQACEFLGVDPSIVPENVGETYNSAFRWRSVLLWRLQRKYQRKLRLPWRLRYLLRDLNTAPVRYPPMDPELRAELVRKMADHNASLAQWLGRDLSEWSR